jgi:hypothetical protein
MSAAPFKSYMQILILYSAVSSRSRIDIRVVDCRKIQNDL